MQQIKQFLILFLTVSEPKITLKMYMHLNNLVTVGFIMNQKPDIETWFLQSGQISWLYTGLFLTGFLMRLYMHTFA